MNVKRKGLPVVASMIVLVLAGALVAPMVLDSARAAPARDPVSGGGTSIATSPVTFEGTMDLVIRGEELHPSFVATLLGAVPSDEGVLHGLASHTLDFGDGNTITTEDTAVLEPLDEYGLHALNETLVIVSGEGDYEGVSGQLHAHGLIHLGLGWAEFEIHGTIAP